MRRGLALVSILVFLLPALAAAQQNGHLAVTVTSAADPALRATPAPVRGAKVIVVHWTHSQLHPDMVQDQVATTDQMGKCTVDLPAGTYDVFISASGLSPVAVKRDVEAGANASVVVTLKPGSTHLRPVQQQ